VLKKVLDGVILSEAKDLTLFREQKRCFGRRGDLSMTGWVFQHPVEAHPVPRVSDLYQHG
jgi:hypothetical protein